MNKKHRDRGHREGSRHQSTVRSPQANTVKKSRYEVTEQTELLPFLLASIANRGRNAVKSALARGQVSVNGKARTAYNFALKPGFTVEVAWGRAPEEVPLAGLSVIHEDQDILVVHKDAGLLSIAAGDDREVTAYRQLTDYVRSSDPSARIFIVHRLDRDTSGVMLFAKNEEAKRKLQDHWQDMVRERTYVALVEGNVKRQAGRIESWLKESKTLLMYSSKLPNDGQHAVTHYKVMQANRSFSLLEVQLETGRKNQIRVHMADIGHPVVGDKKYGSKSSAIGRLGLHAQTLSFEHPTSGNVLRFETPIPKPFLRPFKEEQTH